MNYVKEHPWKVIEDEFHPESNRVYESLMSLSNGHMGHRGTFEEDFGGDTFQGSYAAGIYYPDKTRVGWWKIGYPEYFAKVVNCINIIGIRVFIDGEPLDLHKTRPNSFTRVLDMKTGTLSRSFSCTVGGKTLQVQVNRFLSQDNPEIGAVSYEIKADRDTQVRFVPYLDANVRNEDAHDADYFWENCQSKCTPQIGYLSAQTKKTGFTVAAAMRSVLTQDDRSWINPDHRVLTAKFVSHEYSVSLSTGQSARLEKFFSLVTDRDHAVNKLEEIASGLVDRACSKGYDSLHKSHVNKWAQIWETADIEIPGDISAQQGIRYNIFQLKQTYSGADPRLNIGPKGFTGEKYGGSAYWDTEAYCLPFYLSTSTFDIPRNLLIFRYNHLEKAIENAAKLGLKGALYPMVTMNGEECHNEWEITFEEIHRNAAIAYAIFNYVRYTGDNSYLAEYGLEVLMNISRFWADRVNYNPRKDCYMILGVTGPNEYENNVNNNWYTNRMAKWTLEYTLDVCDYVMAESPDRAYAVFEKYGFSKTELDSWRSISSQIYLPFIDEHNVFAQQDGYMDKVQTLVSDLLPSDLPLNQNWSWDRILRSCFIKQADVLQGLFFLSEEYDTQTKKLNYDFYEPRTVHESSLSPCVHSIIASEIGYKDAAYSLYQRSARLDLENRNNDTEDGLHITSMAGTWMSVVYGFGGFHTSNGTVKFKPALPEHWNSLTFHMLFRGRLLEVHLENDHAKITLHRGPDLEAEVFGQSRTLMLNQCAKYSDQQSEALS